MDPLIQRIGYRKIEGWLRPGEEFAKQIIFDCRMCGQCVLHSTGMTCPMTCPKKLRNGPCGDVRANGNCEVYPDIPCIWVQAFQRSRDMPTYGPEMMKLNPPVNHELEGDSAWINMLAGTDTKVPKGWIVGFSHIYTEISAKRLLPLEKGIISVEYFSAFSINPNSDATSGESFHSGYFCTFLGDTLSWSTELLPIDGQYLHWLDVPGAYEGTGDDVLFLRGADPDLAEIEVDDRGNFIVWSIGREQGSDLLVNEIAPYQGTVIMPRDTFVVIVEAETEWRIDVTGR